MAINLTSQPQNNPPPSHTTAAPPLPRSPLPQTPSKAPLLLSMAAQDSKPFHWHNDEMDDNNFQVHGQTVFLVIFVFFVLLVLTLLSLYAISLWLRYRQRSLQPGLVGLDTATIESFPIFLHSSSANTPAEEAQCSICISAFEEDEKVKVLPQCHHTFHPECVDKWLSTRSTCPVCRAVLRPESSSELAAP